MTFLCWKVKSVFQPSEDTHYATIIGNQMCVAVILLYVTVQWCQAMYTHQDQVWWNSKIIGFCNCLNSVKNDWLYECNIVCCNCPYRYSVLLLHTGHATIIISTSPNFAYSPAVDVCMPPSGLYIVTNVYHQTVMYLYSPWIVYHQPGILTLTDNLFCILVE